MQIQLNKYLKDNHLSSESIALACSAGIDSMVLFHLLLQAKVQFVCLHFDHAVREDSGKAVDFLRDYCNENGLRFYTERANELSLDEASLRDARYDFFERAAVKLGFKQILLAHNLNDQAETLIFRLARGTALPGLQAIPQSRQLNEALTLYRPLLKSSRAEIQAYAAKNSLKFIEDSSNADVKYKRNYIRHKILPKLNEINSSYLENISKLTKLATEQEEFAQELLAQELEALDELPWSLAEFRKRPKYIQRRLLETKFIPNIDFCTQFIEAIEEGGFQRINFAKGKFFTIKQKAIHLEIST